MKKFLAVLLVLEIVLLSVNIALDIYMLVYGR